MARIIQNNEDDDPRYELPDGPARWDWGMCLANLLGTISNCCDEFADLFDAFAGMLGGDYTARQNERDKQIQNEMNERIEVFRRSLDDEL